MSNLSNTARLITTRVAKGTVNHKTLYDIFASDNDFSENEDEYREDTLQLGYRDEAERVSEEIYNKFSNEINEKKLLELMVDEVFNVDKFIGVSDNYGDYSYKIIETTHEYIIVIATII